MSKSNWNSKVKWRRISFNPIKGLPAYSKDEIQQLKIACSDAVCLNLMDSSGSSDGSAADDIHEDEENVPPSIIEAVCFIKEGSIKDELLKIYSPDICSSIETRTVGQSSCPLWIQQHKGRLTSSNIKAILKRKTWDKGYIKNLLMPAVKCVN